MAEPTTPAGRPRSPTRRSGPPDLTRPIRVHIVGIGGSGMSAIALILATMGHQVTGSDVVDTAVVPRLRAVGVRVDIVSLDALFSAATAGKPDVIAHSTAFPPSEDDERAAADAGVDVLTRAQILAGICANRRTIAVSGTHGKTTTSSMLARVLVAAGLRPSYLIGGELRDLGEGAVWDEGEWFVVEADESDSTFVVIGAEIAVVTNVEADHLDHFGSMDRIEAAFDRFVSEAPGPNLVCIDAPNAARLATQQGAVTYGTDERADYRIEDPTFERSGVQFTLSGKGFDQARVHLPVPGLYNARNATAAIATAALLGVPVEVACEALTAYAGVIRRFEMRGSAFGATLVDDYAHNPGKVAAVLGAARAGGWDRVVAVFQPHRYSRTAALACEFADAFADADVLVMTDVYGAGERPLPGVTGKLLVDAVLDAHPRQRVVWIPERRALAEFLAGELREGDLCLTLGAGNITHLADEIAALAGTRASR